MSSVIDMIEWKREHRTREYFEEYDDMEVSTIDGKFVGLEVTTDEGYTSIAVTPDVARGLAKLLLDAAAEIEERG